MTRLFPLLLTAAAAASALSAQEPPIPLTPAAAHADSLAGTEIDVYEVELEADRFVYGEAEQQTVDVVVTVYAPDGRRITTVDGPARGPEPFQFDTESAGRHRIEIKSLEEASGRYSVALLRVEPLAADPERRVDQLMTAYAGEDTPGGVIGVVRDGELVFSKAYGAANLTHAVPFTTATRTNIGSTSKQFTAFAIALLAERGKLSLDDDVRTHLPELPDFGETVTLRNLLTHTSGYREFLNAFALAGRRLDEGDHIARSEIVELVRRQPELQNAPGAEWNYNNTGWALLTLVVERVTGEPFPEWMRDNVFAPLGMESTLVRADPSQIIPNSSQGYVRREKGWRQAEDLAGAMGAGGIYTTVADLAAWVRNFETGAVGGPEVFPRMTTPYVLSGGDTTEYGLGLFVDEFRGLTRVHHGGADVAHRSMLRYYPEIDAAVLALSNNSAFNSGRMADNVAEAFFAAHLDAEEEESVANSGPFDPDAYDPEDFDRLAGRYAMEAAPTFVISFFREGDTLYTQATGQPKLLILPTSDSTFALTAVQASVTFHRGPDGAPDSITLHQNGDHLARRIDAEEWRPGVDELRTYTGRYFSAELETFYEIAIEEEALVLRHRRLDEPVELEPGSERDAFTGGFPVAELEFLRDANGAVSGLKASNGRTRGVRFERLEAGSALEP